MAKRISYKEMQASSKLNTFIDKRVQNKELQRIDKKPKCACGHILMAGETVCPYCKNGKN